MGRLSTTECTYLPTYLPTLPHILLFGRNPTGSPGFLAYPISKACQWCGPGTWVRRWLGVARSASSPKAVQALGCSLTPGLQVMFRRVPCTARAASVPGLWTLGFLLLCVSCVGIRVSRQPCQSWLGSRMCVLGYGF